MDAPNRRRSVRLVRANHYTAQLEANRAKRDRAFDALATSLSESRVELRIALHAVSRRRLAEVAK